MSQPPRDIRPRFLYLRVMAQWEALAKAKRDSLTDLIPKPWLLSSPVPSEQRDATGTYIQQFLSSREIEITETDAVGIVKKTTTGEWKAREVTEAFCHRAALAHQMVTSPFGLHHDPQLTSVVGQLSTRDFLSIRSFRCTSTRRLFLFAPEAHRTSPRPAYQLERPISRQRGGNYHGICRLDWYFRG
jgi:hypothetical protein